MKGRSGRTYHDEKTGFSMHGNIHKGDINYFHGIGINPKKVWKRRSPDAAVNTI